MRRADREVTDRARIDEILRECRVMRLGFNDEGEVYIVPMNFGYDGKSFWFHSAKEGRKVSLARTAPKVGFETDTGFELHPADIACSWSAAFASVIGTGRLTVVSDAEEKKKGLTHIMAQQSGRADWAFDEKMLQAVEVFRLDIETLSCKVHA